MKRHRRFALPSIRKIGIFIIIFIASYAGIVYSGIFAIEVTKDFTKPTISAAHVDDPRFEFFGQKTLKNVSDDFGIPVKTLKEELSLPSNLSGETRLKDLEEYGTGPSDVEAYIVEKGLDKTPPPETSSPTETVSFSGIGQKSLDEVSKEYNVPLDELMAELGIPADIDTNVPIKELEEQGVTGTAVKAYLEEVVGVQQ
jgi:hypothetical protein